MSNPTPITELAAQWRETVKWVRAFMKEASDLPAKELEVRADELDASLAAIPDVSELAETLHDRFCSETVLSSMPVPCARPPDECANRAAITAALQQERDRAAEMVESYAKEDFDTHEFPFINLIDIADRIRNGAQG